MMKAIIALGGNLAYENTPIRDRLVKTLTKFPNISLKVLRVSHWYATPAYPAGNGDDFVNGAALVETGLTAEQIMRGLLQIEAQMGRSRQARWAPRVIDLDLIDANGVILPNKEGQRAWMELPEEAQARKYPSQLILPHPRIQDRNFVLYPLRDVSPDWVHPVTGERVDDLINALPAERRAEITRLP